MIVVITGSRSIRNEAVVKLCLTESLAEMGVSVKDITYFVSGNAPGVDRAGEEWAKEHHIPVILFPAHWDQLGRKAGVIRNGWMADFAAKCERAVVIAVWDGESPGTRQMIDVCEEKGLYVMVNEMAA